MLTVIVAIVLAAMFLAFCLWVGERVTARLMPDREIDPALRRRVGLVLVLMLIPPAAAVWAIANGHAALGIAILVATFVLPHFVAIGLQIRRGRRARG
ncbi:MAG TPA: hypothetical protein VGF74_16330 [Thermoleophilaceae bacterium]|jgi:hypothetical protein